MSADLMMLRAFQREVARQGRYAELSIHLLNGADSALHDANADQEVATRQLWYAIQNFLIAAANISKLMWPPPKKGTKRAEQRRQLRRSLGVSENSILRLSPEFRNHFEHLDERIEDWREHSSRHNLMDDFIGPLSGIRGIDPGDFLRSYDPDANTLHFRGDVFEIIPLVNAISALVPIAEREMYKPHWEEPPDESASSSGSG